MLLIVKLARFASTSARAAAPLGPDPGDPDRHLALPGPRLRLVEQVPSLLPPALQPSDVAEEPEGESGVVVATRGAEPIAEGGYRAVLLLDGAGRQGDVLDGDLALETLELGRDDEDIGEHDEEDDRQDPGAVGAQHPVVRDADRVPDRPLSYADAGDLQRSAQSFAAAALFDETSFAKISITGADAAGLLEWVCDNRVARAVGAVCTLVVAWVYAGYPVATQHNIADTVRMQGINVSYKQALTFLPDVCRRRR